MTNKDLLTPTKRYAYDERTHTCINVYNDIKLLGGWIRASHGANLMILEGCFPCPSDFSLLLVFGNVHIIMISSSMFLIVN